MTISILKLSAGQTIARPFSRASSVDEMRELIGNAAAAIDFRAKNGTDRGARSYVETMWDVFASQVVVANIETETPLLEIAGTRFYAFREA